jgi:hypothetical protein
MLDQFILNGSTQHSAERCHGQANGILGKVPCPEI